MIPLFANLILTFVLTVFLKLSSRRQFHVAPLSFASFVAALQWFAIESHRASIEANHVSEYGVGGILITVSIILLVFAIGRNERFSNGENGWLFLIYSALFVITTHESLLDRSASTLIIPFAVGVLALSIYMYWKRLTHSRVKGNVNLLSTLSSGLMTAFFTILGIGLSFGFALFLSFKMSEEIELLVDAKSWERDRCVVKSYKVTRHESDDNVSFRLWLNYIVTHNGMSYNGNNMGKRYDSYGKKADAKWFGEYVKSEGVDCFYDSNLPTRSLLSRSIGFAPLVFCLSIVLSFFGLFLCRLFFKEQIRPVLRRWARKKVTATLAEDDPLVLDPMLIADQIREQEWLARMSDWPSRMLPSDRMSYVSLTPPFTGEELRRHLEFATPMLERGRWWYIAMTPFRAVVAFWKSLSIYDTDVDTREATQKMVVDFRERPSFSFQPLKIHRKESPYFMAFASSTFLIFGVVVAAHALTESEWASWPHWVSGTVYLLAMGIWAKKAVSVAMVPRPRFVLSTDALYPGGRFRLGWRYRGESARDSDFKVHLLCWEWSRYREGTQTLTATETIYNQRLKATPSSHKSTSVVVEIPTDLPPSYDGDHSGISWRIIVDYAEFSENYPITVYPIPSRKRLKT